MYVGNYLFTISWPKLYVKQDNPVRSCLCNDAKKKRKDGAARKRECIDVYEESLFVAEPAPDPFHHLLTLAELYLMLLPKPAETMPFRL